jgi:hypothetical protein
LEDPESPYSPSHAKDQYGNRYWKAARDTGVIVTLKGCGQRPYYVGASLDECYAWVEQQEEVA